MLRRWFLTWAAVVLGTGAALAQSPTPEQVEIYRNLSPEQRQIVEQQMGLPGSTGGSTQPRNERQLPGELVPQPPVIDEETRLEALESKRRVLRADDSVIVEIDFELVPLTPEGQAASKPQGMEPPKPAEAAPLESVDPNVIGRTPSGRIVRKLSEADVERLIRLRDLVRSRNPYRLDRDGMLMLPGFPAIQMAGLTEEQATLRLSSVAELRDLDVRLRRLPLRRMGLESLKPFGYDLFERPASTFAPVTDVPVPSDYIIGAGDEIQVQLYGNQNRTVRFVVNRDGTISFPELGPVMVAGQSFSRIKSEIEARVARQMIGVRASVSMGDTRSIRVFVLGEARRPGSYTISGLGTITSALFAAGGVRPIGSLRDVQLKRNGAVVRRFDLYDMLIRGDTSDDTKLLPGDVVFIPPVGPTVTVDGEVRRPAIYETRRETTVSDVVALAGGLTPDANADKASLTRIDARGNRAVLDVDLANGDSQPIRNGDLLRVARLGPTIDAGVILEGHVYAPGPYAWHEGLRISEVLRSVDDLKAGADLNYILIRRESPVDRRVSALSADLSAALAAPGSAADVLLKPRDRITVFDLETGRERIIKPLLDELRLRADIQHPTEIVHVDGRAKVPGDYPLEPGMTVRDLIRAGGSLSDAAYGGRAELTRYRIVDGESRRTELIELDLTAALRGDPEANLRLQPFDSLNIKEIPDWSEQETVEVLGEVRFPGRYPISRGETLRSLLARAGGLSDMAFPQGSVFTREELRIREQVQLDMLTERMQKDLAILALQGAAANQSQAATAMSVGQSLMTQLRASKAVGRLVIDLPAVLANSKTAPDVMLRNGDRLIVPKVRQDVTVIGEIQSPTSHLYQAKYSRDDYIALSGGMTRKADDSQTYVVRADGTVIANSGSHWFSRSAQVTMRPGDTVVVPLDTERLPTLPFWQAVTQILYNLAISAAAVNSF